MAFSIAIDGPAGAGKSTIAKELAKRLSFVYVDTGAMYRAIGLYLIRNQISPKDESSVEKACKEIQISISYEDGVQQVFLNGENVSEEIRKEEVGNMASAGAKNQKVREKLVELQRELASKADVVMDGRDIGTCVLPNANVKIYLTASVHTRAVRRYQEYLAKGEKITLEEVEKDIENRAKYKRTYKWNERNQLVSSVDDNYNTAYVYGQDGQRANKYTQSSETLYFNPQP